MLLFSRLKFDCARQIGATDRIITLIDVTVNRSCRHREMICFDNVVDMLTFVNCLGNNSFCFVKDFFG